MFYVDVITKILLFGLLLWTIFSWSDTILAIGLLLLNLVKLFFNSILSVVNSDTTVEPMFNKEL